MERRRIVESAGLPFYGIADLTWDELQLQNGIISIESMLAFLRSGEIVDVPGNTEPPASFSLAEVAGESRINLNLLLESGPVIVGSDRVGEDDEEGIERSVQQVTISPETYSNTAVASLPFGAFVRNTDESWQLAQDVLPPLVRVNGSPFFGGTIDRMVTATEQFEELLRDDLHENFLSSETQLSAREALRGLYEFRGTLDDLSSGAVDFHPYTMYRELRRFYVDACIYRESPPATGMTYDHADLYTTFDRILTATTNHLDVTRRERPYTPFEADGGLLSCTLSDSVKRARDVFWIIERPSLSASLDLTGVKLASRARLPVVHTHALSGVPFQLVANPPFRHGFSSQVEFYTLNPGLEWDHAVTEGTLAFSPPPTLKGLRTFLFWRNDA